ncbi:MAG: hypothetical protein U1E22_01810, partial [Coriobacteriia bacterium]|nr:hypothetical protein [Coriobacteriia bacterium]
NATNTIGTLGSITRGGQLDVVDSAGGLTVTGPITGGTITKAVNISTVGTLAVDGSISTSLANNISLTGTGVTQAGASTVNAGAGTILVDANDGAIDMTTGTLTTLNATGSAITIQDATTVALGNTSAAGGTVVLGVGTDITGAVTQTALTTLNASAVTASTTGSINLGNATNTIGTLGSITRGGQLDVVDSAGGLTVTGPITGGTITNAVNISTVGTLAVDGSISTSLANNIDLTGVGVTQAGASTVDGGAGNIVIDANTGVFDSSGTVQTSGNITISADTITLAGLIKGSGGASEVKLAPDTGSTAINLGATAAAGFALTDTELNTIEAPIVRIGTTVGVPVGGATSGAITIAGNFTDDAAFATDFLEFRTTGAV